MIAAERDPGRGYHVSHSSGKNADKGAGNDPAEVGAGMTSDFSFLTDTDREEARKYAGGWVVIHDGRVIAHSPNSGDLIRKLREENIRGAVFQFVPEEEPAVDLQ